MKSFPEIFCVIDTETTGMKAAYSKIMDIAIIRVEKGRVVERYETFLNPLCHIPFMIQTITGIRPEDVKEAPLFSDVAYDISRILHGAVFVAHNVSFDYAFIKEEFKRVGISYDAPKLCSVQLSRALFPEEKRHNLDAIIERFNIRIKKRHRAMPDTKAVLSFFKTIEKEVEKEKIKSTIKKLIKYPTNDTLYESIGNEEYEEAAICIS